MTEAHDLLPSNATPLERELARLSVAIDAIDPSVIETIWDAWRCPAVLLPHLAWALSVDEWDEAWPEETRRKAIFDSPRQHRIKGTRASVDALYRLLGARVTLSEWHQQTPPGRRGTARMTAYVVEWDEAAPTPLTAERIRAFRNALFQVKPKSRAIELRVGIGTVSDAEAAAAAAHVTSSALGSMLTNRSGQAGSDAVGAAAHVSFAELGSVSTRRDPVFAMPPVAAFVPVTYVEIYSP